MLANCPFDFVCHCLWSALSPRLAEFPRFLSAIFFLPEQYRDDLAVAVAALR
jgi:hypothetical protein